MSEETVTISKHTKVSMPVMLLIGLLAGALSAGSIWAVLRGEDAEQTKDIANHELRIKKLEESQVDFALLKNDVTWIRKYLEKEQKSAVVVP